MKIKTVFLFLLLMLIAFGFSFFLVGCGKKSETILGTSEINENNSQPEETADNKTAKPWVEVVKNGVWEMADNESVIRELKTGDILNTPTLIKTNETGLANLYLTDGSVMRLDINTRLTLENSEYEEKNGQLKVGVDLSVGRLWSKIWTLMTPDSLWEVRTTNAVAVVRGTAYGVEYQNQTTKIIGSDDPVTVLAVDPLTNQIIPERLVVIGENKLIEITKEKVEMIKQSQDLFNKMVAATPVKVYQEEWIKRARQADENLEKIIQDLKEANLSIKEFNQKLKQNILANQTIDQEVPIGNQPEDRENPPPSPLIEPAPSLEPTPLPQPQSEPLASSLLVEPKDFKFEHNIGKTACPQFIANVNFSQTLIESGNTWKLLNSSPNWLSVKTSGAVPETIALHFNCFLDKYITQDISAKLSFQLVNKNGELIGEQMAVNVFGRIIQAPIAPPPAININR